MKELAYGSWPSPITAASLVTGAVGISEVVCDGDDVWWAESRPDEAGRTAIVRRRGSSTTEVTPPDADVRTLAHEYGGGAWWAADGVVVYSERRDQRLRRLEVGGEPVLLTPEASAERAHRYADGRITPDGTAFVCVRERHDGPGTAHQAVNEIVSVPLDGSGDVTVLWQGSDFVMAPRVSPDGSRLAWIAWDHPEMPWTDTKLWCAALSGAELSDAELVAGNGNESLCEPGWSPAGALHVVSDRDEFWNLYRVEGLDASAGSVSLEPLIVGEFEIATPPWVFGMQRWTITPDAAVVVRGLPSGDVIAFGDDLVDTGDAEISSVRSNPEGDVVFVGAGFDHEAEIVRLPRGSSGDRQVLRPARALGLDPALLSEPEPITFATGSGHERAHGLYYAPANPHVVGPANELPPLLVLAHGGPTAQARRQVNLAIRFWTSRGIAVVDVDYRGSTGYGRAYRNALDGAWGEADVEDCVAAARFLVERGDVDPDRLMIRGGSAGGFTVLSALCRHDVFAAGASRYGVADLEALAADTHKFESRYLDRLVGPHPEARDVYVARSPINNIDGLSAPMIVLQGDEDEVVPPNQSEMIVDALASKGIAVAYLLFEGEQHGFRQAANIVAALEAELSFFGQVLGFEPADDIDAVTITNL